MHLRTSVEYGVFFKLINVDILLLFLTIFIRYKTEMHDNRHIVDAIYMHLFNLYNIVWEKERDLTQFYNESPYTNRKINNQLTTEKRFKNFNYTTISDWLRTVNWSYNYPTGVVKPIYGYQTFPLTATAV